AGLYRTDGACVVVDLCIAPAHRGRGHGRRLLDALAARAPRLPLYAVAEPQVGALYAAVGWRPVAFIQTLRCKSLLPMF
ncbi:MAG: GNAT family N-acetyltransferase, partial [Roseateles sp.]